MAIHWLWFSLAGLALITELFTGTFYLLITGIGLAAAGLAAWMSASEPMQLLAAALVATLGLILLRRSRFGRRKSVDTARDPNIHLDIGRRVRVDAWEAGGRARVTYRGTEWDVELAAGEAVTPGWFKILEVRGNRLIVNAKERVN